VSRARGGSAPTPGPRSVTYERVMLSNATWSSLRTACGGMCCTGQHTHGDTSPTKRRTPHERSSWGACG